VNRFDPPEHVDEAALRRLFSFLAQVEVIAIDVPLMVLPDAEGHARSLHERQLADEVFHSLVFARLAEQTGGRVDPIPQAERVLDAIRAPDDAETRAVLLNLVAEEWVETLVEHAVTWGVADEVFGILLADEQRHVEESHVHAGDIEPSEVESAVGELGEQLFALVQNPRVTLPTLELAGEDAVQSLSRAYLETHRAALHEIGLQPGEGLDETLKMPDEIDPGEGTLLGWPNPRQIELETQWRETVLHLWDAPRDPVMHGIFDVNVDHVPPSPTDRASRRRRRARLARVPPHINRYTMGGELYEPDGVNAGVRVA